MIKLLYIKRDGEDIAKMLQKITKAISFIDIKSINIKHKKNILNEERLNITIKADKRSEILRNLIEKLPKNCRIIKQAKDK